MPPAPWQTGSTHLTPWHYRAPWSVRIVLNSRTLVGNAHARAASFAIEFFPTSFVEIDWMQSPLARCVLDLDPADPELQFQLEQDLRRHLELDPSAGADASETETRDLPAS